MIIIHTDGGARGNPGPAGIGIVIEDANKNKHTFGKHIGNTTNNIAEYSAVLFAMDRILELYKGEGRDDVSFFLDSQLVQRQLLGIYKIKEPSLILIARQIKQKEKEWGSSIQYIHIPREQNKEADVLVNQALDAIQR